MSLSVAIAVHNEEKNIIRCLESVVDWVDEIVIVDGASTDNTIELAKKQITNNKIQIIHAKHERMFHINKQKALEACTGDWILQLDADEVVSAELKREIQSVILTLRLSKGKDLVPTIRRDVNNASLDSSPSAQNDKIIAYWMPRLNYFLGKPLHKGGQYPDYTIRLYRNGVARFPCKDVHENVEINTKIQKTRSKQIPTFKSKKLENSNIENSMKIENLKLEIGYLKSPLLHFPYPTFREYLNKWNRYNKLEAEKMIKDAVKPSIGLFIDYILIKPPVWFLKTYFRHKGFVDGFPGFVFSLFSAMRYWRIYYILIT